jgi:hypothetical protein
MARPTDDRFRDIYNVLQPYIEERYGVPVLISDVANPFTGDLDGGEIHVDYDVGVEDAVFIIAHLFGHTVQWNLSAYNREIGSAIQVNPSEERLRELYVYEREACRYSVQLFHDAGVHDVDQWLADFSACDFAYLEAFYRTGEKLPFRTFWKDSQPLLDPLPIPKFQPTHWVSRWKGTVV